MARWSDGEETRTAGGGGDWETGLGAASHVGRRDIAEVLIERGARVDICAAAAEKGGDEAEDVMALLKERAPAGLRA